MSLLASGVILLLVVVTFWPVLTNGFVGYDDPEYVTGNLHVREGLSWNTIRWAFSNTDVAAWHPLVWLSHALDCQLFGLRPWGHHLTALLLHALNAVLCFRVLHRLTGAFAKSWIVAALFALHPLRVESVAWVSERKDVLSMVFFFLTLWAYIKYVEAAAKRSAIAPTNATEPGSTPSPSRFFFALSLIFLGLGLMSKPMLVTTPFVLLLLDFWPLRRRFSDTTHLLVEKIPFLMAGLLVSAVTVLAQPHGGMMPEKVSVVARLENAAVAYCRYLGKIFWPVNLAPFYPPVEHWPGIVWTIAGLLLIAVTSFGISQWRRRPFLLTGWLWFLGTLVPVIGMIQIGEQSITDRYTYLPCIGLLISLVWWVSEFSIRRQFRQFSITILTLILIAMFWQTRQQVAYWKDSDTLFRHTLAVTRDNYLAHNNLGVVFANEGSWAEAIKEYQAALEIKPGYPEGLKNLAIAFEHDGQLDKAVDCYQRALKSQPDFAAARNGLGLLYEKKGRFEEAVRQFEAAIKSKPDYADAHFNLALELEREGRLDEAAVEFQRTLDLEPKSADVHNNLGVLREKQGRLDEAIESYLNALQLSPGFARAYFNLGVALSKKGMLNQSIAAFEKALSLKPDYAAAQTNLAILKSLSQTGTTQP